MGDQTNPRKVTTSGGMTVVSIPPGFLEECGLEMGDHVVLSPGEDGFTVEKVTWEATA